jgi:putative inorganic carbon (hco3(-)) transporter
VSVGPAYRESEPSGANNGAENSAPTSQDETKRKSGDTGLIFFVALLFTRPEETIAGLEGLHLTLFVSVVTLIGMVTRMKKDTIPFVRTPVNGMLAGFFLTAVFASLGPGTTSAAIMDIMRLVMLALLVINLIRTRESYHRLVIALIVFTSYLAFYTIYLFNAGQVIVQDGEMRTKASGIFSDPNDLAATFVAGLALVFARLLCGRSRQTLLYVALAGVLLYAIFLTNSRGGMLALMATMVGCFWQTKLPKPVKIACMVLGTLVVLGVAGGRMTNFDSKEASANSRFWFWSNGCDMLISSPLLGVGYNQFQDHNGGMTAHNSFVLCFGELGALGFYFWMGCIYWCLRRLPLQESGIELSREDRMDLFGSRMALIGYLVASFYLSHTYSPILFVYLSLPVAAQLIYGDVASRNWQDYPLTGQHRGRIILICIALFFFIRTLAERMR